jgi:hypothetical protein
MSDIGWSNIMKRYTVTLCSLDDRRLDRNRVQEVLNHVNPDAKHLLAFRGSTQAYNKALLEMESELGKQALGAGASKICQATSGRGSRQGETVDHCWLR